MNTVNKSYARYGALERLNNYANFTAKYCRPLYWLYCKRLPKTLKKIREKYK